MNKSTAPPPSSLFTAVLFQKNNINTNDDVDVEQEPSCLASLQEPLLASSTKESSTDTDNHSTTTTKSSSDSSPLLSAACLLRLKLFNFSSGSLSALLSQYILSQTLWKEAVLEQPTIPVVLFSLVWSFWTCVIVFAFMFCNVWILEYRLKKNSANNIKNATSNNKTNNNNINNSAREWDRVVFQMEAHHVVGALLAISLAWIFIDVLRLAAQARAMHTGLFCTMTVVCYAVFFRVMVSTNPAESQMMPTYQLLATTLGLIVGLCSQFVLSFSLWKDHMTVPVIANVVVFSLVWSILTVILVFLGCVALRSLALDESYDITTTSEEDAATVQQCNKEAALDTERIHLRMESHYVFATLIGICGAWILMDLVLDMPQQILPSLGMLGMALAAFSAIVHCFPEEQCLEEYAYEYAATMQQEYTSVAVVADDAV